MADSGTDTIFALSSGSGRAGVAVLRLSGPQAGAALTALAGSLPQPRLATLRRLVDPATAAALDDALVLWFPKPASFTGEDVAELHVHGGRAVVRGMLAALGGIAGLRLAAAGEFTRRAFDHGKLDLTQAEGLADLIDAETDAQRAQALRQMGGAMRAASEALRADLLRAQALVEAAIDFADEADVSEHALAEARQIAEGLAARLARLLDDGGRGEIVRDGIAIVLAGPPNVGKSSLINAISRRDVAIVTAEPGTTRDIVEVALDLGGQLVVLSDTAGLRTAEGNIEGEGIRRSLGRAKAADVLVWVVDATAPTLQLPDELVHLAAQTLTVVNKIDLAPGCLPDAGSGGESKPAATLGIRRISVLSGEGIPALLARLTELAGAIGAAGESPLITRTRHRELLTQTRAALRDFISGAAGEVEFRAEDLRRAAHAIGRLSGRIDAEDVLGEIFGRFCIGK